MQVYHDPNRTYPGSRPHPYQPGAPGQTGHVDFKAHPELIESSLEDFIPFAHRPATQVFYDLLRAVNGPASHLETSDCAYRAPKPHRDANSTLALCAIGRVYVLFRDPRLNCIATQIEWLNHQLMFLLTDIDPTFTGAEGVIAFTHVKILYIQLSNGEWRAEGFEAQANDPGHGEQLVLCLPMATPTMKWIRTSPASIATSTPHVR